MEITRKDIYRKDGTLKRHDYYKDGARSFSDCFRRRGGARSKTISFFHHHGVDNIVRIDYCSGEGVHWEYDEAGGLEGAKTTAIHRDKYGYIIERSVDFYDGRKTVMTIKPNRCEGVLVKYDAKGKITETSTIDLTGEDLKV